MKLRRSLPTHASYARLGFTATKLVSVCAKGVKVDGLPTEQDRFYVGLVVQENLGPTTRNTKAKRTKVCANLAYLAGIPPPARE
jgi:hypothetical protein